MKCAPAYAQRGVWISKHSPNTQFRRTPIGAPHTSYAPKRCSHLMCISICPNCCILYICIYAYMHQLYKCTKCARSNQKVLYHIHVILCTLDIRAGWCEDPSTCTHDMFLHVVGSTFLHCKLFLPRHWSSIEKSKKATVNNQTKRWCRHKPFTISSQSFHGYLQYPMHAPPILVICVLSNMPLKYLKWEINWKPFQVQLFLWSFSL